MYPLGIQCLRSEMNVPLTLASFMASWIKSSTKARARRLISSSVAMLTSGMESSDCLQLFQTEITRILHLIYCDI